MEEARNTQKKASNWLQCLKTEWKDLAERKNAMLKVLNIEYLRVLAWEVTTKTPAESAVIVWKDGSVFFLNHLRS
jgi:hypothetical protein